MHNFIGVIFCIIGVAFIGYTFLETDYFSGSLIGKAEYQLIQIKGILLITAGFLINSIGDIIPYITEIHKRITSNQTLQEKESNKEKE